jgi:hypothetical protein
VAPAITTRAVCGLIGEAIGRPVAIMNLPTMTQARESGVFTGTFADEYEELFYQYTEPQIVDSGAIEQAFGLRPTPVEDAIAATLGWFREQARAGDAG